ncbi:MAG: bacillithiol biosynthesis BshC [Candidatus Eisenbacteria bacterium]|nr:bacillithiol biosynthesis BshC [Candidatus Eisenbacteria bacterium]
MRLSEAPLLGRLYSDWLGGDPDLNALLSPSLDPAAWERPASPVADPAALAGLWAALLEQNRRLGASPEALALGERMSKGEADAVITGQQPALLGGPLFSLYKLGTAVALASRAGQGSARPVAPLFWMVSDDTDFPEIRGARLPRDLEMLAAALPDSLHAPHRMVGGLDAAVSHATGAELLDRVGGPHAGFVRRAWDEARGCARDHGELIAAFLLAALPRWPFLVVDARLPQLRAASTPVFDRYLERRDRVAGALREGAEWLTTRGHEVRIEERSGEHGLFRVEGDLRRRWEFPDDPAAARADLAALAGAVSANVVLRPLAQDAVLPVLAQVVGPGEAAYFVQVRRVAHALESRACVLYPRLSASLWPAEADAVAAAPPVEPAALLTGFDSQLHAHFASMAAPEVRVKLEAFERCLTDHARGLEESTRALDPSLAQLIESARGKMDFQVGRMRDGILSKVKARHERQHPRLARLKGFLVPQEKLQERGMGLAAALAQWGEGAGDRVLGLARRHVEDTLAGHPSHYLEPWDG